MMRTALLLFLTLWLPSASTRPANPLPNPHRFAAQIEAFAAADARQMPPPGGIVFVGSSSVRGWRLADYFPGLPVINRGFGGSHTSDCIFYLDRTVLRYRPRVVVLYVGSNDLDAGRPVDLVAADTRRYVEMLRTSLPEVRLLYIAIKPSPSRPDNVQRTLEANALIAQLADELGFDFVDPTPRLVDEQGQPREALYVADRLHFRPEGYRAVAEVVEPVLRRMWSEVSGGADLPSAPP